MSSPDPAVVGSRRVILLARAPAAVRGTAAEFRHFGVSLIVRTDIVQALAELLRDPRAVIIVASDLPCPDVKEVLQLADGLSESTVLFGLHPDTGVEAISPAIEAGADAVIDLPVSPERLRRVLQDVPSAVERPVRMVAVGGLVVDVDRRRVELLGTAIETTPREFDVLLALATAHPRIVTLEELAPLYSGTNPVASVRVAIAALRARFAALTGVARDDVIETTRGVGYRLAERPEQVHILQQILDMRSDAVAHSA